MSARDKYRLKLDCPACGLKGSADVSENDGHAFMRGELGRSIDAIKPAGVRWEGEHDVAWRNGHFVCRCGAWMESK